MIVYHGSNSNFKQLKISKSLVRSRSTELNEGTGIYFSTNKEVARAYGKYLYTLNLNSDYVRDFRKKQTCISYVNYIIKLVYKNTNINISSFIDTEALINRIHSGRQQISAVGNEIKSILENSCDFYDKEYNITDTKRNKIYSELRKIDKHVLKAYMFNYSIKNIGIIRSTDDNIVRILTKENSY